MKFTLKVTRSRYHSERDAEKLKKLTDAGFAVKPVARTLGMDREITSRGIEIEVNTLDDLINLNKHWGCELIFDADEKEITLYDDYLE
ncbi:hypothetical protein [Halomonas halocynthiae]|uniref:hypothetical protein n=1 Tax=Halomonas halocynthiae TaxID=176290 RepID=UPI000405CE12|nr:hypothetical protein [Halomonas halocynthiae]